MEISEKELRKLLGSRFADPTVDFVFKRIFGSERYKAATIGLLNSIIDGHTIVDVEFPNVELQAEASDSRKAFIDVLCRDDTGATFVVEMQNASQRFFRERMLFYFAKLIALQAPAGREWNYHIGKTYSVAFLNFELEKLSSDSEIDEDDFSGKYILHYRTDEVDSRRTMPNSTEYYFISLKNFNKKETELASNADKWLYLMCKSKFFADVPEEFNGDESFRAFLDASARAGFTKDDEYKYFKDMMNDWDIANSKREAVEAALASGRAEGRREGVVEGEAKGKLQTAKSLLALGVAIEIIQKATGLRAEEILG